MHHEIILSFLFFSAIISTVNGQTKPEDMLKKIHWYGQAGIKIDTGKLVIYIDPYKIDKTDKADIILITHSHDDHFSKPDIAKLTKPDTVIIAPFDIDAKNQVLLPNKSIIVKNIKIETVNAYNVVKTKFHPKEKNFVGYILTIDGVRIYHAGDTERIPEMKNFSADIGFFPLGQTYTMNSVDEAVAAALDIKVKIAVPIHFSMFEGKDSDARNFVDTLTKKNVKAVILPKE